MARKFFSLVVVALLLSSGVALFAATQDARAEVDVVLYDTEYSASLVCGPAPATWLTLHDWSSASQVLIGDDHLLVYSYNQPNNYKLISRSVVYVQQPYLDDYEYLDAATMYIYIDSVTNTESWHLALYSPFNPSFLAQPIVAADYDIDNADQLISDAIVPVVGWNAIAFNADGLTYLKGASNSDNPAPMYLICKEDKEDIAPPQLSRGMLVQYDGYSGANPLYIEVDGHVEAADSVKVWDGGGANNLASTKENWNQDTVPLPNNRIIFDATSTKNCTWDLTTTVYSFNISTGYSGTITQGSNMNIGVGGFRQVTGTLTGSSSYVMTCTGSWTKTGGTLTSNVLKLTMSGTGQTLATDDWIKFHTLTVSGTVAFNANSMQASNYVISGTLTLGTGTVLYSYSNYAWSNSGTLAGAGTFKITLASNSTITFGTVNCPVVVVTPVEAAASYTLSLGASATLGTTLSVSSLHASNTATLSHGSNYQLTVNGAVTLGTRGIMTQGTGTWTFGSFTQNGASSVFTQGGNVVVSNGFTMSNGILTGSASYAFQVAGTLSQTAGTVTANVLQLKLNGCTVAAWATTNYLRSLQSEVGGSISAGLTMYSRQLTLGAEATLHLDGVVQVKKGIGVTEPTPMVENLGHINGDGALWLLLNGEDGTASLGYIHEDVELYLVSTGDDIAATVLTVSTLHSYDSVFIYTEDPACNITVLLQCDDSYAAVVNLTAGGTLDSASVLHGDVEIAGGTYREYITEGTVFFYSGEWTTGWTLNQAFSGFVHVYPDWTSPVVQQELGVRTIIELIMILIPAMVLGLFLGGFGAIIGALLMIVVMYFAGAVGLNVLIPGFLAGLLYFVRGR